MATIKSLRDESGQLPAFAWPGGYTMIYISKHGDTLCADCANEPDQTDPATDGDVYWEGPSIQCDNCGEIIESSYGDPDSQDED